MQYYETTLEAKPNFQTLVHENPKSRVPILAPKFKTPNWGSGHG